MRYVSCLGVSGKPVTKCPYCKRNLARDNAVAISYETNNIHTERLTCLNKRNKIELPAGIVRYWLFCDNCSNSLSWRSVERTYVIPDIALIVTDKAALVGMFDAAVYRNKNKLQTRFYLYLDENGKWKTTEHKTHVKKVMGTYIGSFWFGRREFASCVFFKGALFANIEKDIETVLRRFQLVCDFIY